MAKNKEEQARMEGMAYALRVAQEKGVAGLEEEIRMRNITKLPVGVSKAALDECIVKIKENVLDAVLVLSAVTLHDEFGFGQKRLNDFVSRFNLKAECLADDYCTWEDLIQALKEECGLELAIQKNDKDVRV